MTWLVPLPVVMPLLGAALTLMMPRRPRAQRAVTLTVLSAALAVAVALLALTVQHGPLVMEVGAWTAPVGIVLVADKLAALMLVVSAAVTLCVLIYSIGQGMADGNEETPLSIFHPTYPGAGRGCRQRVLAGDLFNLFVGFEILLMASYVLLTLGGTEDAGARRHHVRGGQPALLVIFLSAIGLVYARHRHR